MKFILQFFAITCLFKGFPIFEPTIRNTMTQKSLLALLCFAVLTACGMFKHDEPKVEEIPVQEESKSPDNPTNIDGTPTQADVDRVQEMFPGYTLDQINEGKFLYEVNCALCHDLMLPSSEPEDEWRTIVPDMVKKANKKNGNTLDAAGEEQILRYVITMGPAQLK